MKLLRLPTYCFPERFSSLHLENDKYEAYAMNDIELIVHAPIPSRGIDIETREKYAKILYEELYDGHVKIHRFPMVREPKNALMRALRYMVINHKQYKKSLKENDIDVILGSSTPPTQGLFCGKLAKKLSKKLNKKIPFVYNLQDVFPDSLVSTGLAKKNSLVYKIGNWIANRIYKSADVIITISEDIKKNIMSKGVPEEKIRVIPNWIDTNAVRHVSKASNRLYEELCLDKEKFRIVYAGNLGMAQGVDVLIDAAKLLTSYDNIEFVIFGSGAQEDKLKQKAEGMPNVKFFPLMPQERISEVYSLGDASVVLCKKGTGGAGVPSKTWSIMACATPLLVSFDLDSDYCRIISESGSGLCSDAEDVDALASNIIKLYESADMREVIGANARAYAETTVSKDVCVSKYIELLKEIGNKELETV